jgi:hypothetical protein
LIKKGITSKEAIYDKLGASPKKPEPPGYQYVDHFLYLGFAKEPSLGDHMDEDALWERETSDEKKLYHKVGCVFSCSGSL